MSRLLSRIEEKKLQKRRSKSSADSSSYENVPCQPETEGISKKKFDVLAKTQDRTSVSDSDTGVDNDLVRKSKRSRDEVEERTVDSDIHSELSYVKLKAKRRKVKDGESDKSIDTSVNVEQIDSVSSLNSSSLVKEENYSDRHVDNVENDSELADAACNTKFSENINEHESTEELLKKKKKRKKSLHPVEGEEDALYDKEGSEAGHENNVDGSYSKTEETDGTEFTVIGSDDFDQKEKVSMNLDIQLSLVSLIIHCVTFTFVLIVMFTSCAFCWGVYY